MISELVPNKSYASFLVIDFSIFLKYPYLIIDVDNTLLGAHDLVVHQDIVTAVREARKKGYIQDICLLSNVGFPRSHRISRLVQVASLLNAHYVPATLWHPKPNRRAFEKAMAIMHSSSRNTAVIGDQLFTDIRGGNRLGLFTVLVSPLGKDRWVTRYRRWKERRLK